MDRLKRTPKNILIPGATLAMAALAIILMVALTTTGSAQAQTGSVAVPCGPGLLDVPANPDETITEGHYGVFDGYWRIDKQTLNLNLCPPAVEHEHISDGFGGQVEVSHRSKSNIDIQRTVFHIEGDDFKHTLTAADVERYDFFRLGDPNGDPAMDPAVGRTVWWLKVDDESTPDVDEDSRLAMGFSAALFHAESWYLDDGTRSAKGLKPLQYEFEVIREPGIPANEHGHVFAFDDSAEEPKTAYWDSSVPDARALPLYPGEYHHFQWAFTKPGTYEISVQLKGHVRTERDPRPAGADERWRPISPNDVETSEVQRYVFQIGPLTLNHEPGFVVDRSVEEHSPAGTLVGDPIPVYQGDDDPLEFNLTGPGSSLFNATSTAGGAQISVKGDLDHEVRSEYIITLNVSDSKNRENGDNDGEVDGSILVRVNVTDYHLERSVVENSTGGTLVGDPISVEGANASTTYKLRGDGDDLFFAERDSDNNAQVKVADGAVLNYEDGNNTYVMILDADIDGDGQDVEQAHQVVINVTDDANEQLAITLTADPATTTQTVGNTVTFTGTVTGSPVATDRLRYGWWENDHGGSDGVTSTLTSNTHRVTQHEVATREYQMRVIVGEGVGEEVAYSDLIVIDWQAQ